MKLARDSLGFALIILKFYKKVEGPLHLYIQAKFAATFKSSGERETAGSPNIQHNCQNMANGGLL